MITVLFNTSVVLNTTASYVSINNIQQSIIGSGTSYNASYTVTQSSTQGTINVSFYLVDLAGNTATNNVQPTPTVFIGKFNLCYFI